MEVVKSVIKGKFKVATQDVEVNRTLSEPIKLIKVFESIKLIISLVQVMDLVPSNRRIWGIKGIIWIVRKFER